MWLSPQKGLKQQVGVIWVTCHDIEQVTGAYVVDGLMLTKTKWEVAEGDGVEMTPESKEVVALHQAYKHLMEEN